MTSAYLTLRKRPNAKGLCSVQLKITKDRKYLRLNTGIHIRSEHWDDSRKKIKNACDNAVAQNNILSKQLSNANSVIFDLEASRNDYSLDMIKQRISKRSVRQTFMSRADDFFEMLKASGKVNRYSGERAVINHIHNFVRGRDLRFSEITPRFLNDFKAYLAGTIGISERSIMNYLTTIRTIYNLGIEEGLAKVENYPFGRGKGKIKIRLPESLKVGWEMDEIELLENLHLLPGTYLDHTRKIWLFSFYFAGMRVSDVLLLKWKAIHSGRLHYAMGKNNKPGSMVISEKAQSILDYYAKDKCEKTDLVFPDMRDVPSLTDKSIYKPLLKNRNKKLNKHLKKLATLVGVAKPLTMHIARHSFGNIAGDRIPLQKLQELYRHSSITTTVKYQRTFMNKGTDEALLSVINFKRSSDLRMTANE